MFTGIIEQKARVAEITPGAGGMKRFAFQSAISPELKIDQSLAHDGVCLTVVNIVEDVHYVDVIKESLIRSRFDDLVVGDSVNLERAMRLDARLDGHMVQGHVDAVGVLTRITEDNYFVFQYPEEYANLIVDKGSICINGVSLTVVSSSENEFSVALIPYTLDVTNFGTMKVGDKVNLEFDILGKYVVKNLAHLNAQSFAH